MNKKEKQLALINEEKGNQLNEIELLKKEVERLKKEQGVNVQNDVEQINDKKGDNHDDE